MTKKTNKNMKDMIRESEDADFTINTSCVDCCFAKFIGDKQTGCEIGRIEKYKESSVNVIEAYDDEKEFFVLETFCNCHRNEFWKESGIYHRPFYKNPIDRVRDENKIRCGFNVLVNKKSSFDELKTTLESISDQENITPSYIIVTNCSDIDRSDIVGVLHEIFDDKDSPEKGVKFFYVHLMEENPTDSRCLDVSFSRAKNGYYALFKAGSKVPKNYLSKINHAINEELMRFVALEPEDGLFNGLFLNATTYKLLRGNNMKPILEKIRMLAKARGGHEFIQNWRDLPDE